MALIKYVGSLSMVKMHQDRMNLDELTTAKEYLEKKIQASEEEENYLQKKLSTIRDEISGLDFPPAIRDLTEDEAIRDLTLLILDCEESLAMTKELSVAQVEVIAASLAQRLQNLTLEDAALILHRAKMGQLGTVYRFDLNTVQSWVNQYLKALNELHANAQQNRHLASKEGMSYNLKDKESVNRVARERGINPDQESHYQAEKAEWAEKRKTTTRRSKPAKADEKS